MRLPLLGLLALALLVGCGRTPPPGPADVPQLKLIAVEYGRYRTQNGKNPADEAAFKEHLKKISAEDLEAAVVPSFDDVMISPRDKQPLVVVYGEQTMPAMPDGSSIIAYEKTGVGGLRMVATTLGNVLELNEENFKKYVASGS